MPTIASRHRPAPTRVVLGLLALLAGPGCAAGNWGQDRVRDLADVVDVRYGTGIGLGLGLQVGDIFQTGLGCSIEWYQRQWFGRKSVEVENGLFASGLLITFDGDYWRRPGPDDWIHAGNSTSGSFSLLILNLAIGDERPMTGNEAWFAEPAGDAPVMTSVRIGGALFLPAVNGGLYLNLGELADFCVGLFGADPMSDDGIPKYSKPDAAPEAGAAPPAPAGETPASGAPAAPAAPADAAAGAPAKP